MNEPIAIIGDTCDQVHCFTEVSFVPHEKDGKRWMIMGVFMECRGKEIPCGIDEIRKLRDSLSEWLGDKHEVRALRTYRSGSLRRGLRPAP